ncbi:MAG TPA: caspase family protein [Kofleriaceae bacterium]
MVSFERRKTLRESRDVVAVPTRAVAPATGRLVIATIGIDRYRHWPALTNAVEDATGAAALFQRLGFEEVVPPLLDDRATGGAIEALVADELTSLGASDSLIVFYAGHGGTRTQQVGGRAVRTGYLIPVDGSDDARVTSWIEIDPWLRRIAKLPPRHILVILDACFSGIALSSAVKWGRNSGALIELPFAVANTRPSRLVITSALDDERAMDSGPMPGHSLFTGCLMEALTGGLPPIGTHDGRPMTIGSEIGRYVRNRVQTYPGRPGWQQTPDLGTFDYDERGEMLIPVLIGDEAAIAPTSVARSSAQILRFTRHTAFESCVARIWEGTTCG